MTKKQTYILSLLGVLIVLLVAWGVFWRNGTGYVPGGQLEPAGQSSGTDTNTPPKNNIPVFSPDVPVDATPSVPKQSAPASANPTLDTKILFFDLTATKNGFSPPSFTVHRGDSLHISFTAADGSYDLDFPYLGAYFSVVGNGQTKDLPFDTSTSGTFAFECRDYCPASGKIQGSLIVLPQ